MMFGHLAKLENVIYSDIRKTSEKEREKAKKIFNKILGNYKLTKSEIKYLESL